MPNPYYRAISIGFFLFRKFVLTTEGGDHYRLDGV
jgi:hypothetical protein